MPIVKQLLSDITQFFAGICPMSSAHIHALGLIKDDKNIYLCLKYVILSF